MSIWEGLMGLSVLQNKEDMKVEGGVLGLEQGEVNMIKTYWVHV